MSTRGTVSRLPAVVGSLAWRLGTLAVAGFVRLLAGVRRRVPAPVWRSARRAGATLVGVLPAPAARRARAVGTAAEKVVTPETERDRRRRRVVGLTLPFFTLATVAAFVPLAHMVRMSVSADNLRNEGWSLAAWETLVTESMYWRIAFDTLWFAAGSAVVGVVGGVCVAHALENYDVPFERVVVAVVSFPIALPGIVVAFMIVVLLGRQGVVTNAVAPLVGSTNIELASAYTLGGLFLGYVYSLVPRAAMVLRGTYAEVNTTAEEAARTLGASPAQTFYHVTVPQIRPGIVAALILTFRTGLAIFGTVLVLQSLDVATLQIDTELSVSFNSQLAGAIGVVYLGFVLVFTLAALRFVDTELVEV